MRSRTFIALLLVAIVTSIGATPPNVFAQTTTTIPMLPGTTQPIAVAPGNQVNPHVVCNLVSYTNDDFEGSSTIRYLDFATNTEHVLPGNGLDRLSDTDGQTIVFTELGANGDELVLYDIPSQTTTRIPGATNFDPALSLHSCTGDLQPLWILLSMTGVRARQHNSRMTAC